MPSPRELIEELQFQTGFGDDAFTWNRERNEIVVDPSELETPRGVIPAADRETIAWVAQGHDLSAWQRSGKMVVKLDD